MSSTDPHADLVAALAAVVGADHVSNLTRLSGGASRETWRFEADGRPLVLQRQRGGDVRDMGIEADVVRAAAAAGMPVPTLLASGTGGDSPLGGSFMVLTAVEGETIARKILRDPEFAAARPVLATQLGRALAQLHAVPVDAVPRLVHTDQLQQYRDMLDLLGQPHPAFELAFRWLREHCPAAPSLTLVHGDYRHGNLIIGPDGIRAVLDWELAHLGDPMEDLGWICVAAWRFGQIDKPVGGFGTREALFAAYAQRAGRAVDPQRVHFWEVVGTLRWGVMCLDLASSYPQFRQTDPGRAVERAMIGRRVSETDIDLLRLLAPR